MMPAEPGARDPDFLTRTTLQMEEGLSLPSVAQVIRVLQRVPGVLLAEISTGGSARAIVAHDPAVPTASLLAAAAAAGVRATIVPDARATTVSARMAPPAGMDTLARRLLMLGAGLVFLLALTEAMRPSLAIGRFALPLLLSAIWAFVIARAMTGRHP